MRGEVIHLSIIKASDQKPTAYNRIDNGLFREIVNAGIGWMAKNPEATANQVKAELIRFYYSEVEEGPLAAAAVTAFKLYKQRIEKEESHQKEWQEAVAAAETWFGVHSNDLRHPAKTAQDILNELKPDCGISKLTAAVAQKQEPLRRKDKEELWKECLISAEQHFAANPEDKRHPGRIAEEINRLIAEQISECDTHPYRMLTAAVAQVQKRCKEKEKKELSSFGANFLERKERIKKPGSAARRGNGDRPKNEKGGGKKRGVKG